MPQSQSSDSIDSYAFRLVEKLVDSVTFEDNQVNHQSEDFLLNIQKTNSHEVTSFYIENEDNQPIKNIKWPTIKEFNEKLAIEKIQEFMKTTWEYDECWLFCIDPVETIDKEFTTLYNYRARWSIPTRRRPIPRFTASVYFTFVVSKIKPKDTTVEVYYIFETQKLVHRPGFSRFRQQWLNDIIDLKECLIKDCKF